MYEDTAAIQAETEKAEAVAAREHADREREEAVLAKQIAQKEVEAARVAVENAKREPFRDAPPPDFRRGATNVENKPFQDIPLGPNLPHLYETPAKVLRYFTESS